MTGLSTSPSGSPSPGLPQCDRQNRSFGSVAQIPFDVTAVLSLEHDPLDEPVRIGPPEMIAADDDTQREQRVVQGGDDRQTALAADLDGGQSGALLFEVNVGRVLLRGHGGVLLHGHERTRVHADLTCQWAHPHSSSHSHAFFTHRLPNRHRPVRYRALDETMRRPDGQNRIASSGAPPTDPDRTVAIHTLGCKLNHVETLELERELRAQGYRIVPFCEQASTYIVNTCTVTAKSDKTCRQALRRARRNNPDARVIAVGCYAAAQADVLSRMEEVDWVVRDLDKAGLVARLRSTDGSPPSRALTQIHDDLGRTRAFVKVQDGCDQRCSYCIVRIARGSGRSRPAASVVDEVSNHCRSGCHEVVLTGVNLGAWGSKLEPRSALTDLVAELTRIPELERLRVSSIEPTCFTPALMEALGHPKVCNHWHIPLQSGSTRILRAMRRPYSPDDILRLFGQLCQKSPDCALGTDVVVGFPGETPEDFEQTLRLLEALPLAYLHVFPFSPRPGTEAAHWPQQVPPRETERRAHIVRHLGQTKQHAYEAARIGRRYRALLQRGPRARIHERLALTRNYLKAIVDADADCHNTLQIVRLTGWREGRLRGEIVGQNAPLQSISIG